MTAADLAVAQGKDHEAKAQLTADFLVLTAEMPDELPVGHMSPWRERIDDLRYQCVAVGGDVHKLCHDLDELRAFFIKAWRILAETSQDAQAKLEQAERFQRDDEWIMMNRDFAQIQRSGCMPDGDTVPSLLTFDLDTLRLFRGLFGKRPDDWKKVQAELARTAKEVWDRGEDVPGLRERVEFILQPGR